MLPISLFALALTAADAPAPMAVEVVTDVITDQVRAFATVRADGNRVVISCDPARYEGLQITVHSRRWLARGNLFTGERPIIHRFDRGSARRGMWDVENRSATLMGNDRKDAFLSQLEMAGRLAIRARDIENHRFDMVFPLVDVRPALERMRAACATSAPAAPPTQPI